MTGHSQNNWKDWLRPWIPPRLLDLSRQVRFGAPANLAHASEQDMQFVLPARTLDLLFPGIERTRVTIFASQIHAQDEMVVPMAELLTLAAICRHTRPRRIFEIGTYTGSSTLAMALNTPPKTEIYTLDLDTSEREIQDAGTRTGGIPATSIGSSYRGTPVEDRIHQLFGNSLSFDFSRFYGTMGLVFVDANHTYDFVKADTENALRLVHSEGVIVWDDYRWDERHPECAGVTRYLNELGMLRPCSQISGTRLAVLRHG
jgi:predicted O-methyltransferase YrrM